MFLIPYPEAITMSERKLTLSDKCPICGRKVWQHGNYIPCKYPYRLPITLRNFKILIYMLHLKQTIRDMLDCEVCGGIGEHLVDDNIGNTHKITIPRLQRQKFGINYTKHNCQCRINAREVV